MKTVLEFSDRMPRGLRIRYLKNVVQKNGADYMFKKYHKFFDAINETMCWSRTIEGHEFWEEIANKGIKSAYKITRYKPYFKTP